MQPPTSHANPVHIACRFSKLWVSGFPSLFEVRIGSLCDTALRDLKVELRCKGLAGGGALWHKPEGLFPWQAIDAQPVSCTPRSAGMFPVDVIVRVTTDAGPLVGHGTVFPLKQPGICVFKDPSSTTVNITFEEKSFLGAILQDSELAKIHTYNDLLKVTCTEDFDPVQLHWRLEGGSDKSARPEHPAAANWPEEYGRWTAIAGTSYYLLSTPVSQAMWRTVTGRSYQEHVASEAPGICGKLSELFDDRLPVVGASLHDALEFCQAFERECKARGLLEDRWTVRLPTTQEWERARGPVPTVDLASFCYNLEIHRDLRGLPGRRPRTVDEMLAPGSPVRPLPNGLAGMLGDVFEWCLPSAVGEGFTVDASRRSLLMGGSWHPDDLSFCRGAQARRPAGQRSSRFGFRPLVVARHT